MRNRHILLGDAVLIALAAFGAFALRFEWRFYLERHEFLPYLALALTVKLPMFYLFGMYRRFWRYVSVSDSVMLATTVLMSSMVVAVWSLLRFGHCTDERRVQPA